MLLGSEFVEGGFLGNPRFVVIPRDSNPASVTAFLKHFVVVFETRSTVKGVHQIKQEMFSL
jgi:hypothetical protein